MSAGSGLEYDHPFKLLTKGGAEDHISNTKGSFAQMVLATGKGTAESLFEIAKNCYNDK